jgi:hypothetical protein
MTQKPYFIEIEPPVNGQPWWEAAGEFLSKGRWFWRVYDKDPQPQPDEVIVSLASGYARTEAGARLAAEEWCARHRRGQYTFDPDHRPTRIRKATFRPGGQRFDEPDNL